MTAIERNGSGGERRRSTCALLPLLLLACACAGIFVAQPAPAQEPVYSPDKVKAAFLYHFGSYVEWPGDALPDKFIIGVLGAESIAEELRRIAPGRLVAGRPVEVRRIDSIRELEAAHILFVGEDENPQLPRVAAAVRGRPVLLVTDIESGLKHGASINFTLQDRRVRFEISLPEAKRAGLELSSRLLSVALRVEKTGLLLDTWERQHARLICRWIEGSCAAKSSYKS